MPNSLITNSKPLASPSDPASLSPMEFLKYSQTPSGSKRIQHLLSSGDENVKARIIQSAVLSDLEEMTRCPPSCKVVQKLISCLDPDIREQLAILISKQFSDLDLHPLGHQAVLALLAVGSRDQRDMVTYQLEREEILLDLLRTSRDHSLCSLRQFQVLLPVWKVGCHPLGVSQDVQWEGQVVSPWRRRSWTTWS